MVDDAMIILERLIRSLQAIDGVHVVGTSQDGEDAIRNVTELRPDLVILDIALRESNGWDVLRHIVTNKPETDVFIFSNDASDTARDRFIQGGANGFFDKSLDFSTLLSALKHRVENRNETKSDET